VTLRSSRISSLAFARTDCPSHPIQFANAVAGTVSRPPRIKKWFRSKEGLLVLQSLSLGARWRVHDPFSASHERRLCALLICSSKRETIAPSELLGWRFCAIDDAESHTLLRNGTNNNARYTMPGTQPQTGLPRVGGSASVKTVPSHTWHEKYRVKLTSIQLKTAAAITTSHQGIRAGRHPRIV